MRAVEPISRSLLVDNRVESFMQLSGLEGSVLENKVFEDAFNVESISTAKLLGLANNYATPILTIDTENVDSIINSLPYASNILADISAAIADGQFVTILRPK